MYGGDVVDLKKLQYFVAIVEEGQITRAAQRLHMAQPPLSLQLQALERELGIQLLARNRGKVEPTEAGWALYRRAQEILRSVDSMVNEVKELGAGVRGKLTIGTVMSCVSYLPDTIRKFQARYPQVTFELWEGDSYQVEEWLRTGVIELGITRLPVLSDVEIIHLHTEPLVAVHPPGWGAKHERRIGLSEFADKPLLVLHSHGGRGIYEMFIEMCQAQGVHPNIICESPDVATLLTLTEAGIGVAIVPALAVRLRPEGALRYGVIEPTIETDTAVIWSKQRALTTAATHFQEMLVAHVTGS